MTRKSLVYSTDKGKHCPACSLPQDECRCKQQPTSTSSDGIVRLQRQTKGRNGKPVVIVTGLGLDSTKLKQLAKQLKAKCGVGGTIESGNILIQGDKRDLIKETLESHGYEVKLSGG